MYRITSKGSFYNRVSAWLCVEYSSTFRPTKCHSILCCSSECLRRNCFVISFLQSACISFAHSQVDGLEIWEIFTVQLEFVCNFQLVNVHMVTYNLRRLCLKATISITTFKEMPVRVCLCSYFCNFECVCAVCCFKCQKFVCIDFKLY